MRRGPRVPRGRIALVVLLAAGVGLALAWPRLNDVETGKTKAYPDLQPRLYERSGSAVADAAARAIGKLPGWTLNGRGGGPGGYALNATARAPLIPLRYEVTMAVRPRGGASRLSVRSRSLFGAWDFGQNARNIHDLLTAVDAELGVPAASGVN